MKVLNILCGGGVGGIETLCKEYGLYSAHENKFICIWKPGAVSEEMDRLGIPVEVYDTRPTRYFADFRRLKKDITENSYDALIIHQMAPLISVYLFLIHIRFPKLKVLTYVHSNAHDWPTKGFRRKVDMALRKITYRKSLKTVCISDSVKRSVIEVLGVDPDKLMVIFNGVDCSQFQPKDKEGQAEPKDRLNLIYVGRLEEVKGVQNILMAIAELDASKSDVRMCVPVHLTIVGDGNYRSELEKLSGGLGIADKVAFLGTRRDVPSLLCQSGVFIHTPDCQEGFGITVIEAMAAGCICIVNDHGALPEIVNDGVNGFVVESTDKHRVSEIITDIWNRRSEINTPGSNLYKMKENARIRAQEFSIENFAKRLDETVGEL